MYLILKAKISCFNTRYSYLKYILYLLYLKNKSDAEIYISVKGKRYNMCEYLS